MAEEGSSSGAVLLLLVILLAGGGGAAWYFLIYKKKKSNVPFTKGTETNTSWGIILDGNSQYLAEHDINCQEKPLGRVHLRPQEPRPANFGDYRWSYLHRCAEGGSLSTQTEQKSTTYQQDGRESSRPLGTTKSLQKHAIDCGENKVLTRLKLTRELPDKVRFEYNCRPSTSQLTCRDVTTTPDGDPAGLMDVRYLERHNVVCNDDEVLNSIKLVDSNNAIQYSYKCCK